MNREHIHIACLRCGKITEFVSDNYDKLKQQVEKDCFQLKILVSRLGGWRLLFQLSPIGLSRAGHATN